MLTALKKNLDMIQGGIFLHLNDSGPWVPLAFDGKGVPKQVWNL